MTTKNLTRTPEQAAVIAALKTTWPASCGPVTSANFMAQQAAVLSSTPFSRLTKRHDGANEVLSVSRMTADGWLEIGRYDAIDMQDCLYAESAYAALVKAESEAPGSAETNPYDADHLPQSWEPPELDACDDLPF